VILEENKYKTKNKARKTTSPVSRAVLALKSVQYDIKKKSHSYDAVFSLPQSTESPRHYGGQHILCPLFLAHRNTLGILPAPLIQLLQARLKIKISGMIFRQIFLNRRLELLLCLRRAVSLPVLTLSSHSNSKKHCISRYIPSFLL